MPLQPKDPYSRAAELASQWLDDTSTTLADMLRSDGHAPFAAPVKAAGKLAYYDSVFFNPDGSPNVQGQAAEWSRFVKDSQDPTGKPIYDTAGRAIYFRTLAEVTRARQERMGAGPTMANQDDQAVT